MPQDVTVLLVEAQSLPSQLEDALGNRSMFAETTDVDQLSGTLLVSTPDIIVGAQEHAAQIQRAIRTANLEDTLPFLCVAPRGAMSRARDPLAKGIAGTVPFDMPPTAIVIRVQTVLRKAAKKPRAPQARRKTMMGIGSGSDRPPAQSRPQRAVSPPEAAKVKPGSGTRPASVKAKPVPVPAKPVETAPTSDPERRVSLTMSALEIPQVRIALMDEEVGRADAIASEMRKAGHDVFLLSLAAGASRWRLLRKFAPHAIVTDELALALDGGAWLAAFRDDPFLRHTPLITVPFKPLFDEEQGEARLETLTPRLDGINRAELALLGQLSPRREVEITLSQINPGHLINVLGHLDKCIELTFQSRGETLTWPIKEGLAGVAESRNAANRTVPLNPPEALRWVLDHPDSMVIVCERSLLSLAHARPIRELLTTAYALGLPTDHDLAPLDPAPTPYRGSVPPPSLRSHRTSFRAPAPVSVDDVINPQLTSDSEPPPDSEIPTAEIALSQIPGLDQALRRSAPPTASSAGAASSLQSQHGAEDAPIPPGAPPASAQSGGNNTGVVQVIDGKRPSSSRPPLRQRWPHALGAVAALALGAWGVTSLLSPSTDETAASDVGGVVEEATPEIEPSDSETGEGAQEAGTGQADAEQAPGDEADAGDPETSDRDPLFAVSSPAKMDDCDALLTQPLSYFTSKSQSEGQLLWKRARHQLLIGDHEASNQLMCQAAFIDPSGPASVGLGNYYLSRRALDNAKEWALYGIEQRPDRPRKSQELLGDVYSQMGLIDEARKIWLETMRLDADDLTKLRAVARSLVASAKRSRRGGDFPLAERLLRRAVVFDPDNPVAASQFAYVLAKNKESNLAERWGRRALSMNPDAGDALIALGDVAAEGGDVSSARSFYEQIEQRSEFGSEAKEKLEQL